MSKRAITATVAALLLVAGTLVLLWTIREWGQNRLSVENRSGQPIALLRVAVGGAAAAFRDIPNGVVVTAPFRIKTDDHFAVEGHLNDGTEVGGDFGYVTNGMSGEHADFVVLPDGRIDFDQSNRVRPY